MHPPILIKDFSVYPPVYLPATPNNNVSVDISCNISPQHNKELTIPLAQTTEKTNQELTAPLARNPEKADPEKFSGGPNGLWRETWIGIGAFGFSFLTFLLLYVATLQWMTNRPPLQSVDISLPSLTPPNITKPMPADYQAICPLDQPDIGALHMRQYGDLSAPVVATIPCDVPGVRILDDPILADGETWVPVRYQTAHGWSVRKGLSKTEAE